MRLASHSLLLLITLAALAAGCNLRSAKEAQAHDDLLAQQIHVQAFEPMVACSKAATAYFNNMDQDADIRYGYSNHYNIRLNKCFVILISEGKADDGSAYSSSSFVDLYEHLVSGHFTSWTRDGAQAHTPACDFTGATCKTRADFDALIKPLMTQ
jgi:hypothetical protein